ncbi:MAG: hypothetical protein CVU38_07225, partial [Chloroflexi bacterium HGW-Chloroflexi-1]
GARATSDLEREVDALIAAAQRDDVETVRRLLSELAPEYRGTGGQGDRGTGEAVVRGATTASCFGGWSGAEADAWQDSPAVIYSQAHG